jgi:RNA polymerase sigma-70 factor (ECF subfamily)
VEEVQASGAAQVAVSTGTSGSIAAVGGIDTAGSTGGEARDPSRSDAWRPPTGRRTDEWSECLVLIAAKNDRAAYTRLFRHFAPLIKAFALSGSALSATHADELVQEVMLKVWQKAGAFNPEKAAASTWVYTIARNCRTDMFRRLQKFDTPLAAEDFGPEHSDEEPFLQLQYRRSADRIRDMMGDLPPDQTQILAKVYMEGKSHAEAAAELDLPLGTVKSRVRLAIQKLQVQFERNRDVDLHDG